MSMDSRAVLDLMKHAAEQEICPRFRALSAEDIHEKAPGDVVTVADRESERVIAEVLAKEYPDALIVGEEATSSDPSILDRLHTVEHAWTIDPIDGTKNFVSGDNNYAVMVAEIRGDETVRAWIWEPENNVAHVAEKGAGTYRNEERVSRSVPDPQTLSSTLRGGISSRYIMPWGDIGLPAPSVSSGSAGVDYGLILNDTFDWVAFKSDWPWDHVPGALLVSEAGGFAGRPDGSVYDPRVRRPWIITGASEAAFDFLAQAFSKGIESAGTDR